MVENNLLSNNNWIRIKTVEDVIPFTGHFVIFKSDVHLYSSEIYPIKTKENFCIGYVDFSMSNSYWVGERVCGLNLLINKNLSNTLGTRILIRDRHLIINPIFFRLPTATELEEIYNNLFITKIGEMSWGPQEDSYLISIRNQLRKSNTHIRLVSFNENIRKYLDKDIWHEYEYPEDKL